MRHLVTLKSTFHQARFKWLLVVPLMIFFLVFFVIPVGLIFASSFNPQTLGQVSVTADLTLDNYIRFFSRSNYLMAAGRSMMLGVVVAAVTLVVAYPMAFVIAKPENPARNAFLLILVLARMQSEL